MDEPLLVRLTQQHINRLIAGKRIRVPVTLDSGVTYIVRIELAPEVLDPIEAAEFLPPRDMQRYRRWVRQLSKK